MIALALGVDLPPAQRELATSTPAWAAREIGPLAAEAESDDRLHPGLVAAIRGSGLLAHFVPVEYGGRGLSVVAIALIRERLAYESAAADEFFVAQGIPIQPIALYGSDAQRTRYLPALLDGRLFAFSMTEADAGSDLLGIRAGARRVDGSYELTGTKQYVFAGDVAQTLLIVAKTGPVTERGGLSAFVFDRPERGVTATPMPLLAAGPEWELTFDRCRLPTEALLGAEGDGARIALSNLDRLRPTVGAAAIGLAQRALDETVAHVRDRQAFGGRLADLQGVQFALADAATELAAARSLVYGAARHADGDVDRRAVRGPSAQAKLFATEAAGRVIDTCLQLHGGRGLRRGSVIERLYRSVRAMRIYEGPSEVMKVVIARSLLSDRPEVDR